MKSKIFFLSILLFIPWLPYNHLKAQSKDSFESYSLSDKTFGGESRDELVKIVVLPDDNIIYGGTSDSDKSGEKSQNSFNGNDIWIIKTDPMGRKIWDKTFGGNDDDRLNDIMLLDNGDLLLLGSSNSGISGEKSEAHLGNRDAWIIRVDTEGNKIWDKTIGNSFRAESIVSGVVLSDGTFALSGTSSEDYWLININDQGVVLWTKTIGGSGRDFSGKLLLLPNDELLLGGTSDSNISGDKSEKSRGRLDYWVLKLDRQGSIIWDKTYGGDEYDGFWDMIALSDGTFLIGGESNSYKSGEKSEENRNINTYLYRSGSTDYWVIKIDSDGNKIWDRTIGGSHTERFRDCVATPDGGILLGGHSRSSISSEKSENNKNNTSIEDYWIVKIDNNGNKIWDKTLGGSKPDLFSTLALTKQGEIILGGSSNSPVGFDKTQPIRGDNDFWAIHLENNEAQVELIDAYTQETIQVLQGNDQIQVEDIGTGFFSLVLNTGRRDIGSVHFKLEGPLEVEKVQNMIPYALFAENSAGEVIGKSFPEGDYTLKITPYSEDLLEGEKGETMVYSFRVIRGSFVPSIEKIRACRCEH